MSRARVLAGALAVLLAAAMAWIFLAAGGSRGPGAASAEPGDGVPGSDVPGPAPAPAPATKEVSGGSTGERRSADGGVEMTRSARESVLVRGRLVTREGSPPAGEAVVYLRTNVPAIDYPDAVSRLGGAVAVWDLIVGGRNWVWNAEVEGVGPALRAQAAPDGTFAVAVPVDLPGFWIEAFADLARANPPTPFRLRSPEVDGGITVVMEPAGRVEATVNGPDGAPLPGSCVCLRREVNTETNCARADESGRAEIRGLGGGIYSAVAWRPGLSPAVQPELVVDVGETRNVSMVLGPASSIAGLVLDEQGEGVAGAHVEAIHVPPEDGPSLAAIPVAYGRATTDEVGRFVVGSLVAGSHEIRAEKGAMLPSRPRQVEAPPSGALEGVRIVLKRGALLAGKVRDAEGRPVAGASVGAFPDYSKPRPDGIPSWQRSWQRTTTGTDGAFRLTGLGDGPLRIEASAEGSGSATLFGVEADRENLEVVLPPTSGIAGVVLDATTGEPVRRFTFVIESMSMSGGVTMVSGVDDWERFFESEDGTFERLDLKPVTYTLRFLASGFVPERVADVVVRKGEVTRGLEVRLRRAASVRGKVVERTSGSPVAGAEVLLHEAAGEPPPLSTWTRMRTVSGADGSFLLGGVPPGSLWIGAMHPRLLPAKPKSVAVREGECLDGVVLALDPAGALEGTALATDGSPLVGGTASAAPIYPLGDGGEAVIDGKGRFRIEGLRPGKYRVEAGSASAQMRDWNEELDGRLRALALVEAGRTTRVEFLDFRAGTCDLRGRVLWRDEGAVGVSLRLIPAEPPRDPDLAEVVSRRLRASTGDDGSYRIRRAPAGKATLEVEHNGSSRSFSLELPEGGERVFDVRLSSGIITGRVVRASDGKPLVDAMLDLFREGSRFSEGSRTDPDGRYRMGPLMSGTYWIVARGPAIPGSPPEDQGLASATHGPIRVEGGEIGAVDFSLVAGGEVRVVVLDPEGKTPWRAEVALRREAHQAGPPPLFFEGPAHGDGAILLTGVAPGRYRVDVRAGGFATPPSESVVVRPGEVAVCAVRMDRGTDVRVRLVSSSGAPLVDPSVKLTDVEGREIEPTRYAQDGEPSEVVAHARLADGNYSAVAAARGHAKAIVPIEVRRGAREEFVVKLEKEPAR